jgi:hypothetical protein
LQAVPIRRIRERTEVVANRFFKAFRRRNDQHHGASDMIAGEQYDPFSDAVASYIADRERPFLTI